MAHRHGRHRGTWCRSAAWRWARNTSSARLVDRRSRDGGLAHRDWSPLGAMESVRGLISPSMSTAPRSSGHHADGDDSVTEDMATGMRLHSHGWKRVSERGARRRLAPEDLGRMLAAAAAMGPGHDPGDVPGEPLIQQGLSLGQRMMYFATMWSYLRASPRSSTCCAGPLLVFGVLPVEAYRVEFFERFIPYVVVNQLLFSSSAGRQNVARPAVQPRPVPAVDPGCWTAFGQRRPRPAARFRRHTQDPQRRTGRVSRGGSSPPS